MGIHAKAAVGYIGTVSLSVILICYHWSPILKGPAYLRNSRIRNYSFAEGSFSYWNENHTLFEGAVTHNNQGQTKPTELVSSSNQNQTSLEGSVWRRNHTTSFEKSFPNQNRTLIVTYWGRAPTIRFELKKTSFSNCPTLPIGQQCLFTEDRALYNQSHAALIRLFDSHDGHLPKYKPDHMKWVFFEQETPPRAWLHLNTSSDFWRRFNLTSTYTIDSDVPLAPYNQRCTADPNWKDCRLGNSSCIDYTRNKTGKVLWVVSHCDSFGKRKYYMRDLIKYYRDIDIYGYCGKQMPCGKYDSESPEMKKCMNDLLNQYKFYLAFENGACEGYYTEKFVRTLYVDVIPVVLGGIDYSSIVPEGSFIDVRDFASPKLLAEYLRYLDQNDSAFNEYIERKKQVSCKTDESVSAGTFACRLCTHLHSHYGQTEIAPDVSKFWGIPQRCQKPLDFYRDIEPFLHQKLSRNAQLLHKWV